MLADIKAPKNLGGQGGELEFIHILLYWSPWG